MLERTKETKPSWGTSGVENCIFLWSWWKSWAKTSLLVLMKIKEKRKKKRRFCLYEICSQELIWYGRGVYDVWSWGEPVQDWEQAVDAASFSASHSDFLGHHIVFRCITAAVTPGCIFDISFQPLISDKGENCKGLMLQIGYLPFCKMKTFFLYKSLFVEDVSLWKYHQIELLAHWSKVERWSVRIWAMGIWARSVVSSSRTN